MEIIFPKNLVQYTNLCACSIGRKGGVGDCEIQLSSALVLDTHCEIMNEREVITISPSHTSAKTFINGDMIHQPTILHHVSAIVVVYIT